MPERENKTSRYFRPSEFMRARRPYLYSDSVEIEERVLSREIFEYHLDTLTSRSQEADFERFCRRLAGKNICQNLVPQTGPVGGGDSKVDADTYPVSEEITLAWYEGVGVAASQERWAFAFSAKKDWRAKVNSDVEKAVNTNRGYKRVYFITNQFVKDKDRGQVQDALKQKYSIEVHILDRTWIVERVFTNHQLQLACETLKITGYDELSRKKKGPRDTEREQDLHELESRISEPLMYTGLNYQLAEDCLEAALIARSLELPRVEVDGRLDRARRMAKQIGHGQQFLRIVYAQAWTAFWWYEDFRLFNSLYDEVEALAMGSIQATDIELLSNLWTLLPVVGAHSDLDEKDLKIEERTKHLASELNRLEDDTSADLQKVDSHVTMSDFRGGLRAISITHISLDRATLLGVVFEIACA